MAKIERSIDINAPPHKVWPLLFWDRLPEWLDLFKNVECTSSEKRVVGATFHARGEAANVKTEFDVEITELVENEKAIWRSTGGNFTGFGTTILKKTETGSRITFTIDYELPYSILGKIIDKFMVSGEIEKGFERGLEKLKKILEN